MNNIFLFPIYLIICIILYCLMFLKNELFDFFFEKKYNNIIDYNDPKYTGGIEFIFNPFR